VDISQMSVVASVWDAEGRYALLKFPDGKYYIYKEGMTIGIHKGKVESINENSVLIREMKPNVKGELVPVDTYLKLRKEGK
jgi:Tfp pilus assembly protein PilP